VLISRVTRVSARRVLDGAWTEKIDSERADDPWGGQRQGWTEVHEPCGARGQEASTHFHGLVYLVQAYFTGERGGGL